MEFFRDVLTRFRNTEKSFDDAALSGRLMTAGKKMDKEELHLIKVIPDEDMELPGFLGTVAGKIDSVEFNTNMGAGNHRLILDNGSMRVEIYVSGWFDKENEIEVPQTGSYIYARGEGASKILKDRTRLENPSTKPKYMPEVYETTKQEVDEYISYVERLAETGKYEVKPDKRSG